MKIFTRAIAVVMVIAMFATLLVACGKKEEKAEETKNYVNEMLVGTWEGDDGEEDCTWVFNEDHTCTLSGGADHLNNVSGTYSIADLDTGKIKIKLDTWGEEKECSYTCTEKALLLTVDFKTVYSCTRK